MSASDTGCAKTTSLPRVVAMAPSGNTSGKSPRHSLRTIPITASVAKLTTHTESAPPRANSTRPRGSMRKARGTPGRAIFPLTPSSNRSTMRRRSSSASATNRRSPLGVAAIAVTGSPMSTSSAFARSRVRTASTASLPPKNTRSPTAPAVAPSEVRREASSPPMSNERLSVTSRPGGRTRHTMARSPCAPATIKEPSFCAYRACAGRAGRKRQSPPLGV